MQLKTKPSTQEESHVTQLLRLCTQSDVAVVTNYIEPDLQKFTNNEIRSMLASFANREFTHQRSYALLNDPLGLTKSEFSDFADVEAKQDELECMGTMHTNSYAGLALAVTRSAINEGLE